MKKSLYLSLFIMGLAVFSLPFALIAVDSGKDKIVIDEEVLSGNPAEAAGVTLRLPSHWQNHLLWETEYTIGSRMGAESRFTYSAQPVFWTGAEVKITAYLDIGNDSYSQIVSEASGQTEKSGKYTETFRIRDYSASLPLTFEIEGNSVLYEGDYGKACDYLKDYFHISAIEEKVEVTEDNISIVSAADNGTKGLYFVYCLENTETGEWTDRGQNKGIFYFPYEEQESWWQMDLTQVTRLCDFPDNLIPMQLLADEENGALYVAAREKEGCSLLVYQLDGITPILTQKIWIEQEASPSMISDPEKNSDWQEQSSFCQMSLQDTGILMTWEDKRFSFIARENGQYRWWCSNVFKGDPFPWEQVCIFDGKRLVLAAYEDWYSTNVLLSVYNEQGQTYSGRYIHSGVEETEFGYDFYNRIVPQGVRARTPFSMGMGMEGEFVEPLEMFFTSDL